MGLSILTGKSPVQLCYGVIRKPVQPPPRVMLVVVLRILSVFECVSKRNSVDLSLCENCALPTEALLSSPRISVRKPQTGPR